MTQSDFIYFFLLYRRPFDEKVLEVLNLLEFEKTTSKKIVMRPDLAQDVYKLQLLLIYCASGPFTQQTPNIERQHIDIVIRKRCGTCARTYVYGPKTTKITHNVPQIQISQIS